MTIHHQPGKERIDAVRGFNRFYTRQIGLLDEGLLEKRLLADRGSGAL